MIELPVIKNDPLKRMAKKEVEDLPSPMDPPDAYSPPAREEIGRELAAPLRNLMEDHEKFLKVLTVFDRALVTLKENRWDFTPEISAGLKQFFQCHDNELALHTRKEEKILFPILHKKLIGAGEHSVGPSPMTPVDVMEADHEKISLTSNLVFNLLALASRLKDKESREILFEHAFQQGQEIVDTLKLHIFKENTILFPLAQRLLSEEEMKKLS